MEEGCVVCPAYESVKRDAMQDSYDITDENFVEHNEVVEGFLARVMQHGDHFGHGKCS